MFARQLRQFVFRAIGIEQVQGEVLRELERRFSPEFRNRIDEVVLFAPLAEAEVREIAKHYLQQVVAALMKAGKTIQVEDAALDIVVEKGYNLAFGARFLKRYIDEHIKLPISSRWKEGAHFSVRARDGQIVVEPSQAQVVSDAFAYGDVA